MAFFAEDFTAMGAMCKAHVMEMKDDPAHQAAMNEMMWLDPTAQQAKMKGWEAEFDALPHE